MFPLANRARQRRRSRPSANRKARPSRAGGPCPSCRSPDRASTSLHTGFAGGSPLQPTTARASGAPSRALVMTLLPVRLVGQANFGNRRMSAFSAAAFTPSRKERDVSSLPPPWKTRARPVTASNKLGQPFVVPLRPTPHCPLSLFALVGLRLGGATHRVFGRGIAGEFVLDLVGLIFR